ncbi:MULTISPECIES: restriction endonuclease subunit S [Vibrio]|uniref:restriction endonuclease subunit S n=1 Tax=Vibrio TaxID=662 RepID=UPI00296539EA|nr:MULTISPECIES: restriction endonuclease subunit S [unclassified Vibrio]EIJ2377341.1 restriction endonuclease subunit S [Vibrio alginolyticus]EIO4607216.1 restriction endonuclease subunit S [Vibrio parahaemolyticus]MDW1807670.1 restriction endonuclease subunit S [Vibrio sp. Vb2362]MDW1739165.1 restriction endonuclease subunit S [Vibrio sp. Vb2321]MDW1758715.1 restriction endonuclease subunit S [Vibrio sp. Vb2353]
MALENLITEHIDIWTSAVKNKSTSGRGSSKKLELYGIKKLRELILDLAIRGKLIPQVPSDKPAKCIITKASAMKEELTQQKKIRKQKPLPLIRENETPFKCPTNWLFCRMGDLGLVASSSRVQKKDWTDNGIPFYRAREIVQLSRTGSVDNELFISESLFETLSENSIGPEAGDIMLTGVGTIGVPYVVRPNDRFYYKDASVLIFKNLGGIISEYLALFMCSPLWKRDIHEESMGTTVHTLTIARAANTVIPVPPIAEQHRIVAKVDELMALCDQLEQQTEASIEAHQVLVTTLLDTLTNSADADELMQNWARISEHFDTLFTTEESIDQLKQTILQLAVMGKLVPQDPSDEPASELLKRVAEEKAQLVKEKKIKKQKALPPISEDEKPFELPNGWEWCKFGELSQFINGDRGKNYPNKNEYVTDGIPWINTGHIQPDGTLTTSDMNFITEEKFDSLRSGKIIPDDLVYCLRGATFGKTAFVKPYVHGAIASSLMIIRLFDNKMNGFVYRYLTSAFGRSQIFRFDNGSAQPNLSANSVGLYAFPCPPLEEQKRIVAKTNELFEVCEQLQARIADDKSILLDLTDAIVEQAM